MVMVVVIPIIGIILFVGCWYLTYPLASETIVGIIVFWLLLIMAGVVIYRSGVESPGMNALLPVLIWNFWWWPAAIGSSIGTIIGLIVGPNQPPPPMPPPPSGKLPPAPSDLWK